MVRATDHPGAAATSVSSCSCIFSGIEPACRLGTSASAVASARVSAAAASARGPSAATGTPMALRVAKPARNVAPTVVPPLEPDLAAIARAFSAPTMSATSASRAGRP